MTLQIIDFLEISEDTFELLKELFIVLGIGLIIGLERQYAQSGNDDKLQKEFFAGVRTFPVISILGYLAAYLGDNLSVWIYPLGFVMIITFSMISYYLSRRKDDRGSTTEFTVILVYLLSGLVYLNQYLPAVFIAILLAILLTVKREMHRMISVLSHRELWSVLLFIVITALILPLLPNHDYGIYGAFNPFKIWLVTSIFLSLNFLAYFLQKFIGVRYSILATGLIGGFASSTATAWYFSRTEGKAGKGGMIYAGAVLLASSIMFPRMLVWLVLFNQELLGNIWIPAILLAIIGSSIGVYFIKSSLNSKEQLNKQNIKNPLNLIDAMVFAGFYVVIVILVGYTQEYFDQWGVYLASGISGLNDVDAITIAMSQYEANNSIELPVATVAVLIAALANTLMKYLICLFFGAQDLKKYVSYGYIPLIGVGLIFIFYLLNF